MTTRIEQVFERLAETGKKALIPFIMGYDPDKDTSAKILTSLPASGADIIEIGIPFSDPMADGAVIQAAGIRALASGATVAGIVEMVRSFRINNNETPIILMGYFNPIYRYGVDRFCKDAVAAGVDGIIIVDLPPEEEDEIRPYLSSSGLKLIRLIAPTSNDDRLKILADSASGFIYYISITGITGATVVNSSELETKIEHIRKFTDLPIAVGFGIKTSQQVQDISKFSDAVVVGSALVDIVAKSEDKVAVATDFIRSIRIHCSA